MLGQLRLRCVHYRGCVRNPLHIPAEKRPQFLPRKRFPCLLFPCSAWPGARCGFLGFLRGVQHGVHAIGEGLKLTSTSCTPRTRKVFECAVNSLEHGGQRDARFLPGFDDGPVQGRNQQVRPPFLPKIFFNLGEVVEVIELGHRFGGIQTRGFRAPEAEARTDVVSGALAEVRFAAWFRSQTMRNPSRVRNSSMISMWRDARAIRGACPPVAITRAFSPTTRLMRSTMPSTMSA